MYDSIIVSNSNKVCVIRNKIRNRIWISREETKLWKQGHWQLLKKVKFVVLFLWHFIMRRGKIALFLEKENYWLISPCFKTNIVGKTIQLICDCYLSKAFRQISANQCGKGIRNGQWIKQYQSWHWKKEESQKTSSQARLVWN